MTIAPREVAATTIPSTTAATVQETQKAAPGAVESVADANNGFAFDLYRQMSVDPGNEGKNMFFSPFSLSSALAITYVGARGTTADEIGSTLHFPNDPAVMRQGYSGIMAGMNTANGSSTLRLANALWAEKTYPFLPEYTRAAEQFYGAKVADLDFRHDPEGSRTVINRWVLDQTSGKIQDLLEPGDIDDLTRLVITNAIYFNGTWVTQFDPRRTHVELFVVSSNKTVEVQMMDRGSEDTELNYCEVDWMQVLEMPYASYGRNLSMVVILPERDFSEAEKFLTLNEYGKIRNALRSEKMEVVLIPKFRLESRYSMPKVLKSMGMKTAFTPKADLSGMDGKPGNLFIDDVIHQGYIDVNEQGTEAAAATAVVISQSARVPSYPVFIANRPFIFIIQDRDNNNILFMGRVVNPNET
jgi:serpin B